jgi:D-alanyl-D-alanine dipeptidase
MLMIFLVALSFSLSAISRCRTCLPNGLVYLRKTTPSIIQDIRYARSDNFTGRPVPGYHAHECILGAATAEALKKVQAHLRMQGLSLLVYDCYRPKTAVQAFIKWVNNGNDRNSRDARYHPKIARSRLIVAGYIGANSTHSSGASVDLTLVAIAKNGDTISLEMGTLFDTFDSKSHTASKSVGQSARLNRQKLVAVMSKFGFRNYHREWWHFSYPREPLKRRRFDIPIRPMSLRQ